MKIKIRIDPPILNPGTTWTGTTFIVATDKDFTSIELTSNKLASNGDVLDTLIVQVDPTVNRIYVKNTVTLSDGTVSIPSSPIVIDNTGKSRHMYDALLVTPIITKGQFFENTKDITLTCNGMSHLKRTPNQIKTNWSVYDTDSIPIYNYSFSGIKNSIVLNTSIYKDMSSKFLTASVVQSDVHNDTNAGEIILNEEENKYSIELIGKLLSNGPSVIYVKTNMLIEAGFKYTLLLDGVAIDTGLDNEGHVVIASDITIMPNRDYVLHLLIDTTLDSNLVRNIQIRSSDITLSNMKASNYTAEMDSISISDVVYTQHSEEHYNGIILYNGNIPSIGHDDKAIWFSKRHFDGTPIPSYRKTVYNQIGLEYNVDNPNSSMFLLTGNNRLLTCYKTDDSRCVIRHDQIFFKGNKHIPLCEHVSKSINDQCEYVPNMILKHKDYIYTSYINNLGGISIEKISINDSYIVPTNDITFNSPVTGIKHNVKISDSGTNEIVMYGKDITGKLLIYIMISNINHVLETISTDIDYGNDVIFTPTLNTQLKDGYGISGVFTIFNDDSTRLVQYPITNLSMNETANVSSNGQILAKDKIYIMEK